MRKKIERRFGSLVYGALFACTLLVGVIPATFTYVVDPYEAFGAKHDAKRSDAAEKAHYPLWKFSHYKRDAELVVLGDSRARALRDKYWNEYALGSAFNFAYGGGTIPEIHSTFRAIKDDPKLKTLVVGIQLRSFDERHKGGLNRVPEAIKTTANTSSYLKNWFVFRQSWKFFKQDNPKLLSLLKRMSPTVVGDAFAADLGTIGKSKVSTLLRPDVCFGCDLPVIDELVEAPASKGPNLGLGRGHTHVASISTQPLPRLFKQQVLKNAGSDWRNFQFSERYFSMIKEMADWADAGADRQLIFVIPPTIVEMQNTIAAHGLGPLDRLFRKRLNKLAPVIDFDFPSRLTQEVRNFSDAYHFNSEVARRIVGEIITVKGANEQQAKLIAKKRSMISCPSLQKIESLRESFMKGKSCRVWEKNQDG